MNLRYIALVLIFGLISFTISFQKVNSKELNIKNLEIIKYIPSKSEISLITNANNLEINKFIKTNFNNDQKENFNIIINGIYSFLGFDLQGKFTEIYDGELVVSVLDNNNNNNKDLLCIIKVKDTKNINNIIDIDDNLNITNEIIEFDRLDKLNYLKYIIRTKDNYIIFSSNKELINSSIDTHSKYNNKNLLQNIPQPLLAKIKNEKVLLISNEKLINKTLGEKYFSEYETFITFPKYEKNHINLQVYSSNNSDNSYLDILNDPFMIVNNDNKFLTDYFKVSNNKLSFFKIDINQNEIFKEIKNKINKKIFVTNKDNSWAFTLLNKNSGDIFFEKLNSLNTFNRNSIEIDNILYSVFSKDGFIYKNDKLSYKKQNPIFIKEYDNLITISNDFLYLLNNSEIEHLAVVTLNDTETKNLFMDDKIYLNNFSQDSLNQNYPIFQKLNLFTSNIINLKVKYIKARITQGIPDLKPTVFIESELLLN